MKSLLILLLAVSANALDLTSSGGAGCTTNCTMTSLTTNGTAPSLTATGGVFTSSVTAPVIGGPTGTLVVASTTSLWGNLGIGTASPGAKLHSVSATGIQGAFRGWNTSNGGSADSGAIDIGNYAGGSVGGRIDYEGAVNGDLSFLNAYSPGGFIFGRGVTRAGGHQNFQVGTSTLVAIGSTGNIGIGTASPLVKLQLEGPAATYANPVGFNGAAPGDGGTRWFMSSNNAGTNFPICGQFGEYTNYSYAGICGVPTGTVGNTTGGVGIYARNKPTATDLTQYFVVNSSGTTLSNYLKPVGYTTLQLAPGGAAPTPQAVGMTVYNTTIAEDCKSTAAVSGAWALVGSKGLTGCF